MNLLLIRSRFSGKQAGTCVLAGEVNFANSKNEKRIIFSDFSQPLTRVCHSERIF